MFWRGRWWYRADANCAVQHGAVRTRAMRVASYSQLRKRNWYTLSMYTPPPALHTCNRYLNGGAEFPCMIHWLPRSCASPFSLEPWWLCSNWPLYCSTTLRCAVLRYIWALCTGVPQSIHRSIRKPAFGIPVWNWDDQQSVGCGLLLGACTTSPCREIASKCRKTIATPLFQ